MKRWEKDHLFSVILKNTGKLASGKVMGAILGFAALYSAGKNMTPHDFGTLMLICAYSDMIIALGQFQTWQITLHYGSVPWQRGDREATKTAIRFSFSLDLATGLVSMIVGMAILLLFGHKLGVYHEQRMLALFFCTQIPLSCISTSYGILRLFDRINVVSNQQIIEPFVRSLCALLTWYFGFGLVGFVVAWYIGGLASQIYAFRAVWRVLKEHDMCDALKPSLFKSLRKMPQGTWRFAWTASISKILEAVWGPLTCLLIGKALNPASAGLYRLAISFLSVVKRPAALLEKSYYPEVVRLDPRSLEPWKLAVKMSVISIIISLCAMLIVWIGGKPVIALFGERYIPASSLMIWISPSLIFYTAALPLEGILYSAGRSQTIMVAQFISSMIYIPVLLIGCHYYGLRGAGLSYVFGRGFFDFLIIMFTAYLFLNREKIIPPHECDVIA